MKVKKPYNQISLCQLTNFWNIGVTCIEETLVKKIVASRPSTAPGVEFKILE